MVLLEHVQISRHLELILEVLLGNAAILGLPVVEDACLVQGDDVVALGVVDQAYHGLLVVLEGVGHGGLDDVVHQDIVGYGIHHCQKGSM